MNQRISFISLFMSALLAACSTNTRKETAEAEEVVISTEPEVVGVEVTYSTDSTSMNGYIAYDKNKEGKRPGILVIHEWWGHNDYTRQRADMLAELGDRKSVV